MIRTKEIISQSTRTFEISGYTCRELDERDEREFTHSHIFDGLYGL